MAKLLGEVQEIPGQTRGGGYWQEMLETTFKPNPGVKYEFMDVSSSTAANLRRDYGLDATTRTLRNADGEKELHLYVIYVPDKVDEIKAQYKVKPKKSKKAGAETTVDGGQKVQPTKV